MDTAPQPIERTAEVAEPPGSRETPSPEALLSVPRSPASPVDHAEPLPLADEPPAEAVSPHHLHDTPTQNFRRLLRVVVAFLILFLILRMLVVEPFGVPTGSMAPTLIGNHREGPCPRCGHSVRIGDPGPGERAGVFENAHCPNCGLSRIDLSTIPNIPGDRLMVDKNVYNLRSPRRWEVAVFHCPVDDEKPYVKRVVGLPGEEITLREGDVYANGDLLRKGWPEVREMRELFFDLAFAPKPGGWSERWQVEPAATDPRLPVEKVPAPAATPAGQDVLHDGTLILNAAQTPETTVSVSYRHTDVNDSHREAVVRAWNSYNGPPRRSSRPQPVHDFILACDLDIDAGEGTFSARLFDGADSVTLDLPVSAKPAVPASLTHEKHGPLASAPAPVLEAGHSYHLEFAFVDRRVLVALDGRPLFEAADLPAVAKRGGVQRPLQLGARGCWVILRNLKLYHDIHYTHGAQNDVASWPLGRDEYFMLGDNTTNSHDSREWRDTAKNPATGKYEPRPGVPERDFIGKPFLIHQPLKRGRTTLGGQEREFQTLDWSRLRWLH